MECAAVMKMRFTRAWRVYKVGQVVDIPGGMAAELLARKIAVEEFQKPLIETASLEPVVERADATPKRRRKKS